MINEFCQLRQVWFLSELQARHSIQVGAQVMAFLVFARRLQNLPWRNTFEMIYQRISMYLHLATITFHSLHAAERLHTTQL